MTFRMVTPLFLLFILTTVIQAQPKSDRNVADQVDHLQETLDHMMVHYQLAQFDLANLKRSVENTGEIELELLGQWYVLELQPNHLFAPGFKRYTTTEKGMIEEAVTSVTTYQGRVLGDESSRVSLQLTEDRISGIIWYGDEVVFIRHAKRFVNKQAPPFSVVYRDSDVLPEAQAVCGLKRHAHEAERLLENASVSQKALASNQGYRLQIATEVDGKYWQNHPGTNLNSMITGFVNDLDAIWKENLNLRLQLTFQNVFTISTDPYTGNIGHGPEIDGPFEDFLNDEACTNGATVGLWEQFRNYWNANRTGVTRDLAVLFSGKDLRLCPTATYPNGLELFGTAGTFASICKKPDKAYVLMENYPINTAGLMAHEIGHSLNASHVNPGGSCSPGGAIGPVMCGTVEAGSDYYSPTGKTVIGLHIAGNNGCLTPIYPEIRVDQGGATVTDGTTFTFPLTDPGIAVSRNFIIRNTGPAELRITNASSLVSGVGFSQLTTPADSILAGGSSTVRVRLLRNNTGTFTGTLNIQNNDLNENPYTITLRGTIQLTCATDNQPPTGSVTFPANNQRLNTGMVTLQASASDNLRVKAVAFEINGSVPSGATDLSYPYTFNWNAPAGTHQLRVRMLDECSNNSVSSAITVVVSDLPTAVPGFFGRINGNNLNGLTITATNPKVDLFWQHATDPSGIERYQVVLQPTTGGWLYQPHVLFPATSRSIQTSNLNSGSSYSIHIRAKNNLGNWGPFVNGGTFHVQ